MHIFEEVLFLKLRTTEKQTINATYFVSDASRREKVCLLVLTKTITSHGNHGPFPSASLRASNWHKINWIDCLFFCFYLVRSLKKRTSSKICTFCPVSSIKKRSFNLLCISKEKRHESLCHMKEERHDFILFGHTAEKRRSLMTVTHKPARCGTGEVNIEARAASFTMNGY